MKSVLEFSKTVQELWALHNLYGQLGFLSEDVYLCPDAILGNEMGFAGLQVSQGKVSYVVSIPRPMSPTTLVAEWNEFTTVVAVAEEEDLRTIWEASFAAHNSVWIVHGLVFKGFILPFTLQQLGAMN